MEDRHENGGGVASLIFFTSSFRLEYLILLSFTQFLVDKSYHLFY